jgi:FkbM family methyltransferase
MLAREVGPGGRVVVVEPSPHNVAAARRNSELNPGLAFTLVPAAASDSNGTIQVEDTVSFNLQVSTNTASSEGPKIDVRAVTVDELSKEHGAPDVLFIDVEGYECSVLKGATEVLRAKPDCFVEAHVGHGLERFGSVAELLSFFPTNDFDLFARSWEGDAFHPFLGIDDPVVQRMFLIVALAKREAT